MGCACHLRPTYERLYGRLDPAFAEYLEEIDPTKPGDPLFEQHMMLEERDIAPFMSPADQQRLFADHMRFRQGDASGFAAHSKWEKATFAKLQRRSLSQKKAARTSRPQVQGRSNRPMARVWR